MTEIRTNWMELYGISNYQIVFWL